MKAGRAKEIVREVAAATSRWRSVASEHGLTSRQIELMATAFEHEDATAARAV